MVRVVAEFLDHTHRMNRTNLVEGPDRAGAFPSVWLPLPSGVPSVVPDANVLRNDILRACRTGRTVLVNAANAGALRLFCAQHVLDEIVEHSYEWAIEAAVPHATFIE